MKVSESFRHESLQIFKFASSPFGKPKVGVHVYFLDGLLIDTGHSNMGREVLAALGELPLEQVFITHHHEDHSGNIALLREHFHCPFYASSLCVELMRKPPSISFIQYLSWGKAKADHELIACDDFIETPNCRFEIIAIPGHAADMVCLYEADKGYLFSADLYLHEYIRYFMRAESMAQQITSIKKVLELDFEVLLCSHNPQFRYGKEKLRKKLSFLENFYGKVKVLYEKGCTEKAIFSDMGLKEPGFVKFFSGGALSSMNMIRSVIRDEQRLR